MTLNIPFTILELHGEAADPLECAAGGEEQHGEGPHERGHQEEHAVARAEHVRPVSPGAASGLPCRPAATAQDLRIFQFQDDFL